MGSSSKCWPRVRSGVFFFFDIFTRYIKWRRKPPFLWFNSPTNVILGFFSPISKVCFMSGKPECKTAFKDRTDGKSAREFFSPLLYWETEQIEVGQFILTAFQWRLKRWSGVCDELAWEARSLHTTALSIAVASYWPFNEHGHEVSVAFTVLLPYLPVKYGSGVAKS